MAPSAIAIHPAELSIHTNPDPKVDHIRSVNYGDVISPNGLNAKALVHQILHGRIAGIDTDACEPGEEDAFYVADLGEVYRQHLRWKMNLARVKPFYAVKCNPDPEIIRLLAKLGTGFDCASRAEIDLVLGLGVDASRIIYAQPCKTKSYLRHARQVGVTLMTFDNQDELYKIQRTYPTADLVLRILTDDSASMCRLSTKFGASLDAARGLLRLAHDLALNVVGVSFHVGSGASDPACFARAVRDARTVFDEAETLGFEMTLLDVGGGFVDDTFEVFATGLKTAIEEHFPPHVKIIGEPGRYYAAKAFTLAANIIARREVASDVAGEKAYMLYLNDGVYGNFSNIIFDHQLPVPQVVGTPGVGADLTQYSIWGPTCDGIDIITPSCHLAGTLNIGDWLFFEDMGAYTRCSATRFNGFTDAHEVIYISSEPGASALLGY